MLAFAVPSALLAVLFVGGSQSGMTSEAGWSIGAGAFALLIAVWLFLAGLALVRKRPVASLRVPGFIALAAAILGVLVLLPASFGSGRVSESADFSRILLPIPFSALLAGLGHVLVARNPSGPARALHAIAPLGFLASIVVLVLYVFRVL